MTSKEFEFLKIINNTLNSKYLGNDCAYLDEHKLALSVDTLVEDVHFSTKFMNPSEIAAKSLLVNVSDILASGAEPKYALISLSGKFNNNFIEEFYTSIKNISQKYNIQIIGGDLTKSEKIIISITIIGSYENRMPSSRYNAKNNYIVVTAGEFGSSAQGLEDLFKGEKDNYFINYHKYPKIYPDISSNIAKNAKHPYAMMDSSDGLCDCLYQISTKSNVKININYDKIPKKTLNKDYVLYGGEDYSLVICLNEEDYKKYAHNLIQIGKCETGQGVYVDNKKIEYKGYNHFD